MAIFAIPNPTKDLSIDFPIDRVKKGIERVSLFNKKFQLSQRNDVFNTYIFDVSEALSFGSHIDISLSSVSETKTELKLEVRRKIGTFDKSHEVSSANEDIVKIIDCISKAILLTDEEVDAIYKSRAEIIEKKANRKFKKRYVVYGLLLGFIAYCVYVINFVDVK